MNPKHLREEIGRQLSGVRQALRGTLRRLGGERVMQAQVEGLSGEALLAEFMQQAGLRSKPLAGAQVVVIPLHGKSAHGVVIACANGKLHVANLQDGETALFNETDGHFIHLKNGKIIHMECDEYIVKASKSVTFDTPQTTMKGKTQSDDVLSFSNGMSGANASGGAAMSMQGGIKINNGDVDADGTTLKNHHHDKVTPGNGDTGKAQP